MEDGHAKTSEEVLKYFGTNEETGLTADQVKSFQAKYGPNGEYQEGFLGLFRTTGRRLWRFFHCCTFFHENNSPLFAFDILRPPEEENKLCFAVLIYDFASAECKQKQ